MFTETKTKWKSSVTTADTAHLEHLIIEVIVPRLYAINKHVHH